MEYTLVNDGARSRLKVHIRLPHHYVVYSIQSSVVLIVIQPKTIYKIAFACLIEVRILGMGC